MKSVPTVDCCAGCVPPQRHVGCHGTCAIYLEAKAKRDAYKQEKYEKSIIYQKNQGYSRNRGYRQLSKGYRQVLD